MNVIVESLMPTMPDPNKPWWVDHLGLLNAIVWLALGAGLIFWVGRSCASEPSAECGKPAVFPRIR